jgi:hypothetical protein
MNTITQQLADALRVVAAGNTNYEDLQEIAREALAAYDALAASGGDNANALTDIQRQRADAAERRVEELRELCGDMLKVFEAARPLVLNLERLRDAVHN